MKQFLPSPIRGFHPRFCPSGALSLKPLRPSTCLTLGFCLQGLLPVALPPPGPWLRWVGNPWAPTSSGYIIQPLGRPRLPPKGLSTNVAASSEDYAPRLHPARGITPGASTPKPFPSMLAPCGLTSLHLLLQGLCTRGFLPYA
jgi:hypothetical protein